MITSSAHYECFLSLLDGKKSVCNITPCLLYMPPEVQNLTYTCTHSLPGTCFLRVPSNGNSHSYTWPGLRTRSGICTRDTFLRVMYSEDHAHLSLQWSDDGKLSKPYLGAVNSCQLLKDIRGTAVLVNKFLQHFLYVCLVQLSIQPRQF